MVVASGVRALRIVVFIVGLGEFLTSILLLGFPGVYKAAFGLPPDFDDYFIRQIGMFQFLVGSAILVGSRKGENPFVCRFAVYFNIVSALFWIHHLSIRTHDSPLFHDVVIGFLIYHTVMTVVLVVMMRRAGVPTLWQETAPTA